MPIVCDDCTSRGKVCSLQRRSRVYAILDEKAPFTDGAFDTRDRREKVFWTPKSWFGTTEQFSPVAFKPSIRVSESFGGMSISGGIYSYLWVTPGNQFVMRHEGRRSGRFVFVDPVHFTDEDIARLEIGVKGDSSLLESEYEKAKDDLIRKEFPEYC